MTINNETDYDKWTKLKIVKELEKRDVQIKQMKKRKKYGLVWDEERTKEVFEEDVQKKLPILKEITIKRIDDNLKPNNVLIEGDNYHALSVLNYTHEGKIDVVYIDPPYNRGNDFRYNDKNIDSEDSYRHSKWLSFMKKRLKLMKKLLTDTGLIFISIDITEMSQLKLLCDTHVFYEHNFIACITWRQLHTVKNNAKHFSNSTEYILVYAKNKDAVQKLRQPADKSANYTHDDEDGKGPYKLDPLSARNKNIEYEFFFKKWNITWNAPLGSYPRYSQKTLKKMFEDNEIVYQKGWKEPKSKRYLSRVQVGIPPSTFWDGKEVGFSASATTELSEILPRDAFVSPKPVSVIKRCLEIGFFGKQEGIVLDCMAGSGTTGHAVLQLNKEDGGNRKFILCTNNENNICTEVCYPRLKKVIKGYKNSKNEKIEGLGGNLKYFKTQFIDWKSGTDHNKKMLAERSTEMLCLKEDCFELINEGKEFKIFKNYDNKYLGIIYYYDGIEPFKKEVSKLKKKINTYIFSFSNEVNEDEFKDMSSLVTLKPIPSAILNVYKRIFEHV